jgi:hypothetical protein
MWLIGVVGFSYLFQSTTRNRRTMQLRNSAEQVTGSPAGGFGVYNSAKKQILVIAQFL